MMYHPLLFRETPYPCSPVFTEVWGTAVLGKPKVSLTCGSWLSANDVKSECQLLGLSSLELYSSVVGNNQLYTVEGVFTTEIDSVVNREWIAAVERRRSRIDKYGHTSIEEMVFGLLDQLHVKLQIAVNRGDQYVLIDNPLAKAQYMPFSHRVVQMFKKEVKALNSHCQMQLVTVRCLLWEEECIMLWNWEGKDVPLTDLGPAYYNYCAI